MQSSDFKPTLSVIFPAYNESRQIGATLTSAVRALESQGISFELIVVADGDDGTRELVRELSRLDPRILVLGTPQRRGKGLGVREGVLGARGLYIGFADADNKTELSEFPPFFEALKLGVDVVIGSRKLQESQVRVPQKFYRRIGSWVFNFSVRALFGLTDISDTQCGFKFFRREAARSLFSALETNGYMFDVELLYLAKQKHYRLKQLPVVWRDDGDSRLGLWSGNLKNLKDLGAVYWKSVWRTKPVARAVSFNALNQ